MCGCRNNKTNRSVQKVRLVAARSNPTPPAPAPQVANFVAPVVNNNVTGDRKRIARIHRDAIRKALGR